MIHSHHITIIWASFTTLLISGTLSLSVVVTSPRRGDRVILWDGERLVMTPYTTAGAWTNGGDLATAHGATSPTYVASAANATTGAKAWFQFELAHGTEERGLRSAVSATETAVHCGFLAQQAHHAMRVPHQEHQRGLCLWHLQGL